MKTLDNQPMRGVLFKQTDKSNDRAPDWKGGLNIDGTEWEVAGWEQVSGRGTPYVSLKLSPPRDRPAAVATRPSDADIDAAFERGMRTR